LETVVKTLYKNKLSKMMICTTHDLIFSDVPAVRRNQPLIVTDYGFQGICSWHLKQRIRWPQGNPNPVKQGIWDAGGTLGVLNRIPVACVTRNARVRVG